MNHSQSPISGPEQSDLVTVDHNTAHIPSGQEGLLWSAPSGSLDPHSAHILRYREGIPIIEPILAHTDNSPEGVLSAGSNAYSTLVNTNSNTVSSLRSSVVPRTINANPISPNIRRSVSSSPRLPNPHHGMPPQMYQVPTTAYMVHNIENEVPLTPRPQNVDQHHMHSQHNTTIPTMQPPPFSDWPG